MTVDRFWVIRRHPDGGYATAGVEQRIGGDVQKGRLLLAELGLTKETKSEGDSHSEVLSPTHPQDVTVVHLNEEDSYWDVPIAGDAKRFSTLEEATDWAYANADYFDYLEIHPECNIDLDLVGKVEELWGGGEMEWTADADPHTEQQIVVYRKNGIEYRCGCGFYDRCYCYEKALEDELGRLRGLVTEYIVSADTDPIDSKRYVRAEDALRQTFTSFPAKTTEVDSGALDLA